MKNSPSIDEQIEMYRRMVLVRRLEEKLGELHKAGKTRGPIHRCDGQEAVGVAATAMLSASDFVTSTHRGHAHYIGKGLNVEGIAAEILGRETGYCGGRAGHMLIGDKSQGLIGGNAIVGASIPAAGGMALSIQIRGTNDVAILRVERLCPFPFKEIIAQLKEYKNASLTWAQEEPKNAGA